MNIKLSIVSLTLLAGPAMAQDDQPATAEPVSTAEPISAADLSAMLIPWVTIDPDAATQVNIARTHTGQILFPATVNGQDLGWWLLDTGASDNVIDTRAAKEVGLEPVGSIVTKDFSGIDQTSSTFAGLEIIIGNCTIEQPLVASVDMIPISSMIGQPVIGIIGMSTLSQIVLELDYLAPVAHIHHPDSFDSENLEWTPVSFDNSCPVVAASYEGVEGNFVVNTALGLAVNFSRDTVIEHSLIEERETREWVSVGVGGRKDVSLGFIEEFEFLGQRLGKLPAVFEDPEGYPGVFPDQTGMIGSLVLRHYNTTFDLGRSQIAFTPVDYGLPAEDLFLADIVGTYKDRTSGGTMVITWDGEIVSVILGSGQPELELRVFNDSSFYFPAAWINGRFQVTQDVVLGMVLKFSDGRTVRAIKID